MKDLEKARVEQRVSGHLPEVERHVRAHGHSRVDAGDR